MTCSLPTLHVNAKKPLQLVVQLITYWELSSAQLECTPCTQLGLASVGAKESDSPQQPGLISLPHYVWVRYKSA